MRLTALPFCLLLSACAPWPDAGGPALEQQRADWPALEPLSELITTGSVRAASDDDATRLAARAATLRNRASILRSDTSDADAMEALRARLR